MSLVCVTHKGEISPLGGHAKDVFEYIVISPTAPFFHQQHSVLAYRLRDFSGCLDGEKLTALLSKICCGTFGRLLFDDESASSSPFG